MEQDPELVTTIQGSPNIPQHRGTGTHLNSEVGSLQVAPSGGRGNPNTSTTGKYHRQTHVKGGYCSFSADTMNGTGGRTIGDEGRTLEGMAKVGDQLKRPRHRTLGQTSKCGEVSVQKRTHAGGTGMDNDGAHT